MTKNTKITNGLIKNANFIANLKLTGIKLYSDKNVDWVESETTIRIVVFIISIINNTHIYSNGTITIDDPKFKDVLFETIEESQKRVGRTIDKLDRISLTGLGYLYKLKFKNVNCYVDDAQVILELFMYLYNGDITLFIHKPQYLIYYIKMYNATLRCNRKIVDDEFNNIYLSSLLTVLTNKDIEVKCYKVNDLIEVKAFNDNKVMLNDVVRIKAYKDSDILISKCIMKWVYRIVTKLNNDR